MVQSPATCPLESPPWPRASAKGIRHSIESRIRLFRIVRVSCDANRGRFIRLLLGSPCLKKKRANVSIPSHRINPGTNAAPGPCGQLATSNAVFDVPQVFALEAHPARTPGPGEVCTCGFGVLAIRRERKPKSVDCRDILSPGRQCGKEILVSTFWSAGIRTPTGPIRGPATSSLASSERQPPGIDSAS